MRLIPRYGALSVTVITIGYHKTHLPNPGLVTGVTYCYDIGHILLQRIDSRSGPVVIHKSRRTTRTYA